MTGGWGKREEGKESGHGGRGECDELEGVARQGAVVAIGIDPVRSAILGCADRVADDGTAGRIPGAVVERVGTYERGDHGGQLSPVVVFGTF